MESDFDLMSSQKKVLGICYGGTVTAAGVFQISLSIIELPPIPSPANHDVSRSRPHLLKFSHLPRVRPGLAGLAGLVHSTLALPRHSLRRLPLGTLCRRCGIKAATLDSYTTISHNFLPTSHCQITPTLIPLDRRYVTQATEPCC